MEIIIYGFTGVGDYEESLYFSFGKIEEVNQNGVIIYTNDTEYGFSGGPIFGLINGFF